MTRKRRERIASPLAPGSAPVIISNIRMDAASAAHLKLEAAKRAVFLSTLVSDLLNLWLGEVVDMRQESARFVSGGKPPAPVPERYAGYLASLGYAPSPPHTASLNTPHPDALDPDAPASLTVGEGGFEGSAPAHHPPSPYHISPGRYPAAPPPDPAPPSALDIEDEIARIVPDPLNPPRPAPASENAVEALLREQRELAEAQQRQQDALRQQHVDFGEQALRAIDPTKIGGGNAAQMWEMGMPDNRNPAPRPGNPYPNDPNER